VKLGDRRTKKLKNLLIDRIDLVDVGDNPEAKIMLFKRADPDERKKKTRVLKDLEITEVSLVDKGASPGAEVMFLKRDVEKQTTPLRTALLNALILAARKLGREKGITRLDAFKQVMETEEGKKALEILTLLKGEKKTKEMDTRITTFFKRAEKRAFRDGTDFYESLRECAAGIVEQSDIDKTPDDFVTDLLKRYDWVGEMWRSAGEKKEPKPDFGVAYRQIEKRAKALLDGGHVGSLAQGFDHVVQQEPALFLAYLKETA